MNGWELRIFGSLTARRGERVMPLGPLRHRALLGLLLARRGYVVPVSQLVEELWAAQVPRSPVSTIQTYVSHLRRALRRCGELDGTPARVSHRGGGYQLEIDPEVVDAFRFETLVDRGRHHADRLSFAQARDDLDRALALWRDRPYLEFGEYDVMTAEAERLQQVRVGAVESWARTVLALGGADIVVSTLQPEIRDNPTHERLVGHLMTGLYQLGRQAEALRLFEGTRRSLADELGVDPGSELQRVHAGILNQDLPVAGRSKPLVEPPLTTDPAPHGQPLTCQPFDGETDPTGSEHRPSAEKHRDETGDHAHRPWPADIRMWHPFVGRRRELAWLRAHVRHALEGDSHLIAVLGDIGIGKTELVLETVSALHHKGLAPVMGHCLAGEGVPPYWVWSQIIRQLAQQRPESFARQQSRFGDLLDWLMMDPGSGVRECELTAPVQFRMHDAMCETLLTLAAEEPLMLVLENIEDADRPTLRLLDLLRTRLPRQPLAVLVTCATPEHAPRVPGGWDTAEGEVYGILMDPRTLVLRLGGLSEQETAAFIAARTGEPPAEAVAGDLHRRTQGSPYLLGQLIAGLDDPQLSSGLS